MAARLTVIPSFVSVRDRLGYVAITKNPKSQGLLTTQVYFSCPLWVGWGFALHPPHSGTQADGATTSNLASPCVRGKESETKHTHWLVKLLRTTYIIPAHISLAKVSHTAVLNHPGAGEVQSYHVLVEKKEEKKEKGMKQYMREPP